MTDTKTKAKGVHLVGSVNLESSTAVFTQVCKYLGGHLHRIPDGETGNRKDWIGWQMPIVDTRPELEKTSYQTGLKGNYGILPDKRLRGDITADELQFPSLGYSAAAIASYAEFTRLKDAGIIPKTIRFQVSLPTPLAPVYVMVVPEDQTVVEAAYERQMRIEIAEMLAVIPVQDLAIQWDSAIEFAILEGLLPTNLADPRREILDRLVRLGNDIPNGVELGYHLCYGDAGHKHFKEPEDMSKLVDIANGIAAGLERPVNWVHMPVPRDRADAAYYSPLKQLDLHLETELYLGLVHRTDGVEGTWRRIKAARQFVQHFGVATECGLGRRPPETIAEVLQVHAAVADPVR